MQFDSSDIARFESKVDRTGGCHLWTANRTRGGYGHFRLNGKMVLAHRLAYEIAHGPGSADGFKVLHNCPDGDNPACVNDAHLWRGSQADNVRDRDAKGRRIPLRGDENPSRKHPERLSRGDDHYSRREPWRMARGERNARHTHPERTARGERHGLTPFSEMDIREIRAAHASGQTTAALARHYSVSAAAIYAIVKRKTWRHVE